VIDAIQPANLDAERALLGALLVDRGLIPETVVTLKASDFYGHIHEILFDVICKLNTAGKPSEKYAVAEELQRRNALEKCGGLSYLNSLMDSVQTTESARYYATIIREKALLRRLAVAGRNIYELGLNGHADVLDTIASAQRELSAALLGNVGTDRGQTLAEAVDDVIREIDAGFGKSGGMTTPWPKLDKFMGLLFPGEMCVWAAAPAMGKSIAVSQLALHIAEVFGQVAFLALEMGTSDTVRRMVGKESEVSSRRIRSGDLKPYHYDRIAAAKDKLSPLPIRIFNRFPKKSVADLRRALTLMAQDGPISAVVVDHANFLADANADTRSSKHERLDRVYQELLGIASEFSCVMHVVQHLNRDGMKGRPSLENLRDGGNLEGHAHVVVLPYRPEIETRPEYGQFIIAKNRDGESGPIDMVFNGAALKWSEA
jgi:replicative DNA helicase